jgi:hypothetical protein
VLIRMRGTRNRTQNQRRNQYFSNSTLCMYEVRLGAENLTDGRGVENQFPSRRWRSVYKNAVQDEGPVAGYAKGPKATTPRRELDLRSRLATS